MKMTLVPVTKEDTTECWLCGNCLWQPPVRRWVRALQEYITDSEQPAFKLRSDTHGVLGWLCRECADGMTEESLREALVFLAEDHESKAKALREMATESLRVEEEVCLD